jgi:protocatechuate 3,4-dioxygenase beta subunit
MIVKFSLLLTSIPAAIKVMCMRPPHIHDKIFIGDDEIFIITNLYDFEGDETDDPDDAVSAVARSVNGNEWLSFLIEDVEFIPHSS